MRQGATTAAAGAARASGLGCKSIISLPSAEGAERASCCSMRCAAALRWCRAARPKCVCDQQWLDTCTHPRSNMYPPHTMCPCVVSCPDPPRTQGRTGQVWALAAYCEGMCQLLLLSVERVGLAGASAGAAAAALAAAAVCGCTSCDSRRLARVMESCLPQANRTRTARQKQVRTGCHAACTAVPGCESAITTSCRGRLVLYCAGQATRSPALLLLLSATTNRTWAAPRGAPQSLQTAQSSPGCTCWSGSGSWPG
jgi:hypothetical protein